MPLHGCGSWGWALAGDQLGSLRIWHRLPRVTGGRSPGTGSGRGFLGLSFSVRIPGALRPGSSLSPAGSSSGSGSWGGAQGAGLRALSLCRVPHQTVLLSTVSAGPGFLESISDPLEFVSTVCALH